MAIGPTLPPHLVKRKRSPEDSTDSATEQSSRQVPGSSPDSTSSKRTKVTGPEPPPVAVPTVRRPVAGPSLPPGPLDERPTNSPSAHNHLEDDSDDDFGPALPSADAVSDLTATSVHNPQIEPEARDEGPKLKRDDWMIAPPDGSDWSARADPLKLQGRKFNTGKSARTPGTKGAKESVLWTETAEQKRKRLEDEVMGVQQPAQSDQGVRKSTRSDAEKRETEKRIREYNEQNRNASLYAEHQKTNPREKEDDPSKRTFDREKDMGGGIKLDNAKKKELLQKSADFGSRFAKGSYL